MRHSDGDNGCDSRTSWCRLVIVGYGRDGSEGGGLAVVIGVIVGMVVMLVISVIVGHGGGVKHSDGSKNKVVKVVVI